MAEQIKTGTLAQLVPAVTRTLVRKRTHELAQLDGRTMLQISQVDYEQAKRELTGESDPKRQDAQLNALPDNVPTAAPISSDETLRSPDKHTPPEHFTSGFGAVIVAEHDLRDQLYAFVAAGHSGDIMRILQHHALQLDVIIALLDRRDKLLPYPQRFEALDKCTSIAMYPLRNFSRNLDEPLGHLAKLHQTLRQGIEALIDQSGHHDSDEISLREAARRHAEMESTLIALQNKNDNQRASTVEAGNAEVAWENEGGHGAVTAMTPALT